MFKLFARKNPRPVEEGSSRAEAGPSVLSAPFDLAIFERDVGAGMPFFQSTFRVVEYAAYLRHFKSSVVFATSFDPGASTPDKPRPQDYLAANLPQFVGRVRPCSSLLDRPCRLAYTVFLSNAWEFLGYFEENGIPFSFTLYPGGSFLLNDKVSDAKLARVLSSPCFRKVIVTQELTRRYVLDKGFCREDQIEFIYGGVFPVHGAQEAPAAKPRYPADKSTLDICFVAHKYSPGGKDKGFDVFMDSARRLAGRLADVRFHVVGNFSAADVVGDPLEGRLTFYGTRPPAFFAGFYRDMDLIVSANIPFVLAPGAFDGFPTGCCIEAAMCGVAVICTDPLGLNIAFRDGEEIFIIPHEADAVCERILALHATPALLHDVAERGQQAMRSAFSEESQLSPRFRMLSQQIAAAPAVCTRGAWRGFARPVLVALATGLRGLWRNCAGPPVVRALPEAMPPLGAAKLLLLPGDLQRLAIRKPDAEYLRTHEAHVQGMFMHNAASGLITFATVPHYLAVPTTLCFDIDRNSRISEIEFSYLVENMNLCGGAAALAVTAYSGRGGSGQLRGKFHAELDCSGEYCSLSVPLDRPGPVRSVVLTLRSTEGSDLWYRARLWISQVFVAQAH